MTQLQRPSVGRTVHYVSHGTPRRGDGSQVFASQCRAAIITEVEEGTFLVGLAAINPTGFFFHSLADGGCLYNDGGETPGDPTCVNAGNHAAGPHRYCGCGWMEAHFEGGTWHWPERMIDTSTFAGPSS